MSSDRKRDDIRERAEELIKIGNDIQEKIDTMKKIEEDLERLQIYRNERGDQLLHKLMEHEKENKDDGI